MAEPNGYIQGSNGVPLELIDKTARADLAKIPRAADLRGTTATFRNSAGVALFTLDLSGLGGGSAAVYGSLVLSAEELTIGEGQNGTFTVALDQTPSANQSVYLAVSDGSRLSVEPAVLTFTPENWETPQTVTVTSLEDDDEEDDAVTVTLTSTSVDARQVAVAIRDNDISLDIITDGLALFADYTTWDGASDTIVDKAGGVTLSGLSGNWEKVQNGIKATAGMAYKTINVKGGDAAYSALVNAFNQEEITVEWFGSYHFESWALNSKNSDDDSSPGVFQNARAMLTNKSAYGVMCGTFDGSTAFGVKRPYLDASGAYRVQAINVGAVLDAEYVSDFCHVVTVFRNDGTVETYHNGVKTEGFTYENWASWPSIAADSAYIRGITALTSSGASSAVPHADGAWLSSQRLYSKALTQDEIVHNMHAEGQRLGLTDFI